MEFIIRKSSRKPEDTAFKRKLERELGTLLKRKEISTEHADGQAALAGLCKKRPGSDNVRERRKRI